MRLTRAEVDLAAIRHNVKQIRQVVGQDRTMVAVVKANAYGHGAVKVGQTALAAGANCLAVAIPEEGAELRQAGISVPIFNLGLVPPGQADIVVDNDIIPAVSTKDGIRVLAETARSRGRDCKVMLKIDTGMSRIGIPGGEAEEFVQYILDTPGVALQGIFTHLATADAADKAYANKQLALFGETAKKLSRITNLTYIAAANSGTIIDLPDGYFNTVRPGIILYGIAPSAEMHNTLDLRPAMEFKTCVVYVKRLAAGTPVGYGCTWAPKTDTYIATLPVGYADGYSRHLSRKASVLIGGKRRPIAGGVCMDQMMVDIGPVCDVAIGDEVVLFGRQGQEEITATELGDLAGTIPHELTCRIAPRVPRVYLNE